MAFDQATYRRRRHWAASLLLLAWLCRPATAGAQPAGAGDGRAEAQAHLSRGNDLFTTDKFEQALTEFQAAFAAFPSPKLHFNIGQCQRALGHQAEALAEFRRFVDEAGDVPPDLRREAERYIAELMTSEERAAPPPPPAPPPKLELATPAPIAPPPAATISPAPATADPDATRPLYKRWWFWTAIGVVAAGAVGVVLLTRPKDPSCTAPRVCL